MNVNTPTMPTIQQWCRLTSALTAAYLPSSSHRRLWRHNCQCSAAEAAAARVAPCWHYVIMLWHSSDTVDRQAQSKAYLG